ncbi:MAG: glycosyltransferase [Rhizobiaceae bacterium]
MNSAASILVDLTDILVFSSTSASPTGIQRVQLDVFPRLLQANPNIVPVYFDAIRRQFRKLDFNAMKNGDKSYCLVVARTSQKWLARIQSSLGKSAVPLGEIVSLKNGDTIYVAGAGWFPRARQPMLRCLARKGINLIWMCFDLVPLQSPVNALPFGYRKASGFRKWLDGALEDHGKFICISEHVRNGLETHAASLGLSVDAVTVPLAHEFRFNQAPPSLRVSTLAKQSFALYVSSLGLRKNHMALLQSWQRLKSVHGPAMPKLVLVGSPWKETDIFPFLEATNWLDGSVFHLSGLPDSDLAFLYKSCRFTVYPSLNEGWGLPVGESLWMGKPCVCADNSSLPEVGRNWVTYFKADEPSSMDQALDRAIRGDFDGLPPDQSQLRTWEMVAAEIADQVLKR